MSQLITISKSFSFEASHVLPKHPGKCSNLHGHSWKLTVAVRGPVREESGFVVDYAKLGKVVKTHVISVVDHSHLGQENLRWNRKDEKGIYYAAFGENFYPSSENLVVAFARILSPLVQELGEVERIDPANERNTLPASIQLAEVSLDETCTCRATWRPQDGR